MDITIFVFVLIVTLSRPGNPALASSDVESVNDYSNTNTLKAEGPLMPLNSMGNVEEIEKFGKREIEQSIKLPSLIRKARCKYSRLSWRSKKAKKNEGLSITPLKHISASRSSSANEGMEDSLRKPDIRAPSAARAKDPTHNFNDPRTTKRENEHGVEEIVMLPPQTVDSVVVISEGARTASNETPKSYVCGTFDTKEKATKMSKERPTFYDPYETRQRPAAKSEPTKIGIPLNSARETNNPQYKLEEIFHNFPLNNNQRTSDTRQPFGIDKNVPLNRNLDEPSDDPEDSLFDEHDVNKPPTNKLELDDCIKNYGLEHCIPVPGEFRSSVQNHQSEMHEQRPKTSFQSYTGKSMYQNTLMGDAMIQNNRNLDESSDDLEDSLSDEHDVHKPPTNKLELDDCIKNYGLEHCIPVPGEFRSSVQNHQSEMHEQRPETSFQSHAGKSMYQDTLVGDAMIQNTRNLDESSDDPEDSLSDEHDVHKPPTNKLELDDCINNYGLEHCIPVPGEFRSSVQNHQSEMHEQRPKTSFQSYTGKSMYQDTLVGDAMIQNNRNLDESSDDPEDSLSDEHDVHKPPTNKLELDDCINNYGLEHCIPVPGEFRSSVQNHQSEMHEQRPKTSFQSYIGKSMYQNTLVGDAMIQNNRNLDESSDDPEDSLSDEHEVHKPPTNKLELDDCIKNYGLEHCIPVPGEFRSSVQNVDYASISKDVDEPKKNHDSSNQSKGIQLTTPVPGATKVPEIDGPARSLSSNKMAHEQKIQMANKFGTSTPAKSLKQESSTGRPRIRDELALARRLLRIPEVQHLALQDTKLFLSDLEDLSTFGFSMAHMADETLVTLIKNVADYLSTAIEADLQPIAQLAGQTAWNDQQTLPDKNLKQYIKNLLRYSGLTAEGVQSEASKNILFRTIQHTLKNAGFKVNNAHIWDTLKTVISQTRLPRMNSISVFPSEERTSVIRSADMSESGFKRLPFIPVKERVFKDGRWAEKSTLLGSSKDRFEPKSWKAQSKKTEQMDQSLLADSGKASSHVAESAVGESPPVNGEFETNDEENEKTPIKYYSQAGRLLAYRKKIQVPKVMFHLEENKKVFPRAPGLSPVADASFPVKLPPAAENGLQFTKDSSKSTPPALPNPNSPSSEKFREQPDSLSNFDLRDDHEEFGIIPRSESGFKTILKEDSVEQATESLLDAAKNFKRGTWNQQNANKRMIARQDQVSTHEQTSVIDRSPSATPEYDPTYFGKMTLTSAESPPSKMSDLTVTDLFYVGDGVKIPLKISRISDGSWGLSISEKISESFGKQNCPCNVPSKGDIVEEKKRQKKNSSLPENTGQRPIPKNRFLIDGIKSSISDVDQPKERRTRSFLENDFHTTSSSPVTEFIDKYNLTLNPKNISNSSGPWPNSTALNNDIEIFGSRTNGKSSSTTPDSECTENWKRTINDIIPKNESQLDDHDVTESSKNSNVAEDEHWTIVRGSHEIIDGVFAAGNRKRLEHPLDESKNSNSAHNVGSTMNYEDGKGNDPPKNEDNVSHNRIDDSITSSNVRDLRSTMNYQDNIIDPNVLDLYDVSEREDNNIIGTPVTNEMNSHFAENPLIPPEPSKIDNMLQAGNDEVMDRWSWLHDLVDSRRKHNVVMNSQDMDEAILLKIDDMFKSGNDKFTKDSIDAAVDSNSAKNVATTMNYQAHVTADRLRTINEKNDNPMLDHEKIADSRETKNTEFGINSIDSSKESEAVQNGRPRTNDGGTDEPNRETLIDKKKLKERDDHDFFRTSNVKAKSDSRRDNPTSKRTRLANKKRIIARPYRYQQYIDDEAQERMDLMTGVLYWLKEVFFEPSAESDD